MTTSRLFDSRVVPEGICSSASTGVEKLKVSSVRDTLAPMRVLGAAFMLSSVAWAQMSVPAAFSTRRNTSTLAGPVAVLSSDAGVLVLTADPSGPVSIHTADASVSDFYDVGLVSGLALARGVADVDVLVLASVGSQGSLLPFRLTNGRLMTLGTHALSVSGGAATVLSSGDVAFDPGTGRVRFARVEATGDGGVSFIADASVTVPSGIVGLAFNPIDRAVFVSNAQGLSRIDVDGTITLVLPLTGVELSRSPPAGLAMMSLIDGGALLFVAHTSAHDVLVFSPGDDAGLDLVTRFTVTAGSQTLNDPLYVAVSSEPAPGFPSGALAIHDRQAATGSLYRVVSLAEAATLLGVPELASGVRMMAGLDAGIDGGLRDGGTLDGGSRDAGALDAGVVDGGAVVDGGGSGAGGSGGGGSTGRGGNTGRGGSTGLGGTTAEPLPSGCGCGSGPLAGWVLMAWLLRRRRAN